MVDCYCPECEAPERDPLEMALEEIKSLHARLTATQEELVEFQSLARTAEQNELIKLRLVAWAAQGLAGMGDQFHEYALYNSEYIAVRDLSSEWEKAVGDYERALRGKP